MNTYAVRKRKGTVSECHFFRSDAPRRDDVTKKKRHSRLRAFASTKKKSHRPVGTPEDRVASFYGKAPRARCREDAPLAPTRARDRPRRAASSSLGRPRHVPRTPRDPAAPDLDARARRRRDGRGWKTCSRSRLAIFQRPRLLAMRRDRRASAPARGRATRASRSDEAGSRRACGT